jgi:hypothetical protein
MGCRARQRDGGSVLVFVENYVGLRVHDDPSVLMRLGVLLLELAGVVHEDRAPDVEDRRGARFPPTSRRSRPDVAVTCGFMP